LDKKSTGVIKRWQKRYFEIAGHYLKYSQDERSINEISIRSSVNLYRLTACKYEGNFITLTLGSETTELQGPNEEETHLWFTVFEGIRQLSYGITNTDPRTNSQPAVEAVTKGPPTDFFGVETPCAIPLPRATQVQKTNH
jgi:hypothetical protein